jgi:hypothetical protein
MNTVQQGKSLPSKVFEVITGIGRRRRKKKRKETFSLRCGKPADLSSVSHRCAEI